MFSSTNPTFITLLVMIAISTLLLVKIWQLQAALSLSGTQDKENVEPPEAPDVANENPANTQLELAEITNAICEGYMDAHLMTDQYQFSDNWYLSMGYRPTDLPDQFSDTLREIVHPDDLARVLDLIKQPLHGDGLARISTNFRLRHADGHWAWSHGVGQVFFDGDGNASRLIASHTDISEFKDIERDLRNSHAFAGIRNYRFDIVNDIVELGSVPLLNQTPSEPDQWIRGFASDLIHRDDLSHVIDEITQAAGRNQPLNFGFRVVNPDGKIGHLVLYGSAETDANGTPIYAKGVFREVTEQKRSESRYVEFGKLLDDSLTGLVITRIKDLKVLYANQKYCDDSGFEIDEIIGIHSSKLIFGGDGEKISKLIDGLTERRQEEKKWHQAATKLRRKDGGHYPADVWTQLSEWEGEPAVATMILDITGQVEAQEALQRSEQKYRSIFDALPDGVVLCQQPDLTVLDCNQELADSHGWELSELKGKHVSMFARPGGSRRQTDALAALEQAPDKIIGEGVHVRKDNSEFPVEAHLKTITIGQEAYIVTVVRDITERHRYVKRLEQQKAEIEQFTFSISHDLKSPLVTIEGFSEILAENLANNDIESAQDDLRRISSAAEKMHRLLTDLLEFSRLGITPHKSEPTALNKIIDDARERTAGQIAESSATITVEPNLPTINCNPDRLAQLYQNLIDNAIKFRRDDNPLAIDIGWDTQNNYFFVDDNGRGIPLQFQNRVFGLFDQLDPGLPGSGIGLASVKRIIETHGGKIWVKSPSAMGGTRICFSL